MKSPAGAGCPPAAAPPELTDLLAAAEGVLAATGAAAAPGPASGPVPQAAVA